MRWDKPNIPHRGWEYIGMEDLGEDVYPGDPIPYEQCEMCGKEKIRYVHLRQKFRQILFIAGKTP